MKIYTAIMTALICTTTLASAKTFTEHPEELVGTWIVETYHCNGTKMDLPKELKFVFHADGTLEAFKGGKLMQQPGKWHITANNTLKIDDGTTASESEWTLDDDKLTMKTLKCKNRLVYVFRKG